MFYTYRQRWPLSKINVSDSGALTIITLIGKAWHLSSREFLLLSAGYERGSTMDKAELKRAEWTERRKLAKEQKQERQKLRNEQAKRRKANRTTNAGGKREGAGRPQEIPFSMGAYPQRKPCSFYVSADEKNAVSQFLKVFREIRYNGDSSLLAQVDGESVYQLLTGGMITNPKDRETLRQIMPNVAELEWTVDASLAALEKKLIKPPAGNQGRPRRVLTDEERQEIQERHKAGETIGTIAKALHMGTRTVSRALNEK